DRAFLGATCTHTLDLSRGKLTSFPGTVDAYLEFLQEKRVHEERSNESIMAKRRHLEEFIAKNKARAATATLARSKSKQLERLELTEVAGDEPTARIRAPRVEPRKGPALRCRDLAIGYPERQIASGVELEIDHGSRAAVVGDNGQGKTTFLRTVVSSLEPLAGEVRWGHGCQVGAYAQHVYTSLPAGRTVLDYLQRQAARGKEYQGTVIFTSHDRHFSNRVATCIVEVRDGRVTHYGGPYEAYVSKVNKEIEAGERALAAQRAKLPPAPPRAGASPAPRRNDREA